MARSVAVWSLVLGVLLSTQAIFAQDEAVEVKKIRFEAAVQILALEQSGVTVTRPAIIPAKTEVACTCGCGGKACGPDATCECGGGAKTEEAANAETAETDADGAEADETEAKPANPQPMIIVDVPAPKAEPAACFKAYPYGTQFDVPKGVKFRLRFSDLTNIVVRGPAKFTPYAMDTFRQVILDVQQGDINIAVDRRAAAGQFTVLTPMGNFTSLQGTARLHVGNVAEDEVAENDFSFRVLSGSAVFCGHNYKVTNLSQANAFRSATTHTTLRNGKTYHDTRLEGLSGDVTTLLPIGISKNVDFALTPGMSLRDLTERETTAAATNFSLAPGATVKITRAKHPTSEHWVVSVLTFFANGKAQNYFCYVDGRDGGYALEDLVADELPSETEEEKEDTDDDDGDTGFEGLDDFGDEDL